MESLKHVGDSYPRPGKVSMLTLDEAINELTHPTPWVKHTALPTYLDAAKLGAEALNAIQDIRARFPTLMPDPLPGETKC
ncbi:hypothetical protein ES708_31818 [subsurface metagenome]